MLDTHTDRAEAAEGYTDTAVKLIVMIMDDVLELPDFPVMRLWFDDYGNLVRRDVVREGVYDFPSMDGWTLSDLHDWLHEESPEHRYPQVSHALIGSEFHYVGHLGVDGVW